MRRALSEKMRRGIFSPQITTKPEKTPFGMLRRKPHVSIPESRSRSERASAQVETSLDSREPPGCALLHVSREDDLGVKPPAMGNIW